MKIIPDFTRLHSGENDSRVIRFSLSEKFRSLSVKLCFVSPLGKAYVTDGLSHENGEGAYPVPAMLLDGKGVLLCQIVCTDKNGLVAKSAVSEFPVFSSADDMSCPALSPDSLKSLAYICDALCERPDREEIAVLLSGKSDTDHLHGIYLTEADLYEYLPSHPSSGYEHTHDGRYYKKEETDALLEQLKTDYVTEFGHQGKWTYRKWNSGLAECWGEISHNVEGGAEKDSNFRFPVEYPLHFSANPIAFIHPLVKAYQIKKAYQIFPTDIDNKKNIMIYAKLEEDQVISASDNKVSFYVQVKGTWK